MMKNSTILIWTVSLILFGNSVWAEGVYYGRLFVGASVLGNQDLSQNGLLANGVTGEMETSLGYRAGFSIGRYWNKSFSTEITWDYITNQGETTFSDGTTYSSGDYSSRLHFINNYYHFEENSFSLKPYIGFGLGIIQEIDVDLENSMGEQSFSDDGGVGYQVIVGAEYEINSNWGFTMELTNIGFSGPDFRQEGGPATISDSEGYSPWNINLGLKYSF